MQGQLDQIDKGAQAEIYALVNNGQYQEAAALLATTALAHPNGARGRPVPPPGSDRPNSGIGTHEARVCGHATAEWTDGRTSRGHTGRPSRCVDVDHARDAAGDDLGEPVGDAPPVPEVGRRYGRPVGYRGGDPVSTVTWPPLPGDVGRHPQALEVLVALPSATDVWGRAQWGVGHWGGWRFADPVPMECDVQGLTIERGRTDPLAHVQAGQLNVTVEDPDREWAPWVIPPDGFRSWRTGVPVQVRTSQGVLFTGSVAEITAAEEPKPDRARTVDFKALDPLTFLAASDQAEQYDQGGGELAGARLERIWSFARPPGWVDHRYDPGLATMQATSLAKAALEESWLTADSDAGMMTCTADGVVRFWDQNGGLADDRKVVPQYTFTDDDDLPEDVPVICTSSFSVSDDQGQVINWVAIAATGGTEEIAEDTASQSLYGIKTTPPERPDPRRGPGLVEADRRGVPLLG